MKRSKIKRLRKHGFLCVDRKKILLRRRRKGRWSLTV